MYDESGLRNLEDSIKDSLAFVKEIRDEAKEKESLWQCILDLGNGFTRTLKAEKLQCDFYVPISRSIIEEFAPDKI